MVVKPLRAPRDRADGFRVYAEGTAAKPPVGYDYDLWVPELAPGRSLHSWWGEDHGKWEEFRIEYLSQLKGNPFLQRIVEAAGSGHITLLTESSDPIRSPAAVLASVLRGR